MKRKRIQAVWMILWMLAGGLSAAPLSQEQALERARSWMDGHPVMGIVEYTVESTEEFPGGDAPYSVFVVSLSPTGHLVLNSNDRLPLTVSFSAESSVDLSDSPHNAFRAMLLDYCERAAEKLKEPAAKSTTSEWAPSATSELHGPFLETSWNQDDPYNLLCPNDPAGNEQYGYRAPSGCVPTAFAQVLNFHRWPVHGTGSRSYTDSSGSITGSHSATFSDSYDWGNMKASHSPYDSPSEKNAIAELMSELGVVAEANYESSGTSASIYTLGTRLDDYLFYASVAYNSSSASLTSPMETDLRAGFPCVVSIPNHAIVADGLMVDGGSKMYHINYGWGGNNNGWFTASGIPGGSLRSGITSIRPQLMAFPESESVVATSGSPELTWILPKRLEDDVSKLTIKRWVSGAWETFAEDTTLASRRFSQTTTAWDDCDDFSVFELTSSDPFHTADWAVNNVSGVGNCFYKTVPEYNGYEYHLTSRATITPTATTRLKLHAKYKLVTASPSDDVFRILVSTDRSTFTEIWAGYGSMDWGDIAIDLSTYAGQAIYVRLKYESGYYTAGGGIWIDSIRTQETTHPELEGQPVHYTQLSGLSAGTYTLAATLTDHSHVEHDLGPSFTLTVESSGGDADGDLMPDEWEALYGLDTGSDDSGLDPDNDGLSNLQEYICGSVPNDGSSSGFCVAGVVPSDPAQGFSLDIPTLTGRQYTVQVRPSLTEGVWTNLTTFSGTGETVTVIDESGLSGGYYRVLVQMQSI